MILWATINLFFMHSCQQHKTQIAAGSGVDMVLSQPSEQCFFFFKHMFAFTLWKLQQQNEDHKSIYEKRGGVVLSSHTNPPGKKEMVGKKKKQVCWKAPFSGSICLELAVTEMSLFWMI